jgi:YlmC/YmxH family sporulation protein
MSAIRVSELRQKDVVNVADGRRLGLIGDLELDLETGRVTALVIAGTARFLGLLGRDRDTVIPWPAIVKIGQDVILVRLESSG